jgi:acetate kinase
MAEYVVALNAGSSSIKFSIFSLEHLGAPRFKGQIEKIGVSPRLKVSDGTGRMVMEQSWDAAGFDHAEATQTILKCSVQLLEGATVAAIGHRVVHGGAGYARPVRVDKKVYEALEKLVPLAPLHQPHNLALIATILKAAPHLPQVACFDTAFHRTQPEIVQEFALPRRLTEAGVRRYGFHGISYEYVSRQLRRTAPDIAQQRVVIAHLGNGASLCAVQDGKSVASTMGFTALDGLMMGTRCGAIDPGVLLYLLDEMKMDARQIEHLLYKESGLLGVSGISSDMRELRAAASPAAEHAIAMFVYRIVREIGSLAAALGGLDGIVFTAGIGEHDAVLRASVCRACGWLGVEIDEERNAAGDGPRISVEGSPVSVWVVPTDEEGMIASHVVELLGLTSGKASVTTMPQS